MALFHRQITCDFMSRDICFVEFYIVKIAIVSNSSLPHRGFEIDPSKMYVSKVFLQTIFFLLLLASQSTDQKEVTAMKGASITFWLTTTKSDLPYLASIGVW